MHDTDERQLGLISGASSGIGLELARQFAENGLDVIMAADDDQLGDAAADIRRLGAQVEAVRVDLSTPGGVELLYGGCGRRAARWTRRRSMRAAVSAARSPTPRSRQSFRSST